MRYDARARAGPTQRAPSVPPGSCRWAIVRRMTPQLDLCAPWSADEVQEGGQGQGGLGPRLGARRGRTRRRGASRWRGWRPGTGEARRGCRRILEGGPWRRGSRRRGRRRAAAGLVGAQHVQAGAGRCTARGQIRRRSGARIALRGRRGWTRCCMLDSGSASRRRTRAPGRAGAGGEL